MQAIAQHCGSGDPEGMRARFLRVVGMPAISALERLSIESWR
jgi:hypothetical protein